MYIIEDKKFKKLGYVEAFHSECNDPNTKYPTLLLLHGAGTRGTDLNQIRTGRGLVNAEQLDVKLRIYAPQCYANTWFEIFEQLIEFAEFVKNEPNTDPDRYYIAGASMGGYTTWQLGMTRPKLFAAMAPICGGGMYWNAGRLKNIPVWAFHGALDNAVYVTESINMVNAVNRAGGNAKLTIYPKAEHNAWEPTYSNPEFWQWMLQQHK